jgi:GMP synthase (glutamine-hydrolysing)
MIVIINNSGPLKKAYSTPQIIDFFKKRNYPYKVVSDRRILNTYLITNLKEIKGVILSGSDLKYTEKICTCQINMNLICLLEFNIPILGICFGYQTIAISFGGRIKSLPKLRKKKEEVILLEHPLFKNIPNNSKFQQYNHDYVSEIPISFRPIAYSNSNILEGIAHYKKPIYGIQFHPELSGKYGQYLLNNFIEICENYK